MSEATATRTAAKSDVLHRGNPLIQKVINVVSRLETGRLSITMPDGSEY